ncbi:MAG: hypothetical protein ACREQ5_21655 [Candidatus Dormibacteria bacterium]
MQHNVLERYPRARIRVYAVWTDKRFFDSRDKWDAAGLVDRRVTHLWDGPDLAGQWLVDHAPDFRGGDWDAYALFGPETTWTRTPPTLVSSGSTVIGSSDELARAMVPLVAGAASARATSISVPEGQRALLLEERSRVPAQVAAKLREGSAMAGIAGAVSPGSNIAWIGSSHSWQTIQIMPGSPKVRSRR